jgi:hypothetical protein
MKKFTLRHEINCSVDHFWEVFFDPEFNKKLFLDELGFPQYETLDLNKSEKSITRKVKGTPKMDMPKPVVKLLGEGFSYEESGTFDKDTQVWKWKMKPAKLADKLRNEGEVTCERISDDKCRRVATIEIEAKVFGVGGLIESSSEKQMKDGWNKSADFMNRWLEDHPPE